MKIYLIRHGATAGNLEKKYIGCRTDEPLCAEGIRAAEKKSELTVKINPDAVFSSPMKRCIQTAGILFPGRKPLIYEELSECDFGRFEGKNYRELSGDEDYQKWIDSGGTMQFPEGELPADFRKRCCSGFERMVSENSFDTAVLVAHGGTIMSVLSEFAPEKKDYFSWHTEHLQIVECQIVSVSPVVLKVM